MADQPHRPLHGLLVVLPTDLSAAHRHALADVGVQARAAFANVLREVPIATGQAEHILRRLHHLPHGKTGGIGADVLRTVLLFLQHRAQPRPGLLRQAHIAVPLIILQQNVVFGRVGFDLACLQHQGLKLALADDHIKLEGMVDHLRYLVVVGHTLAEILADTDAQAFCLADVDDLVLFVPNDIHPGQKRQHLCLFIQFCLGQRLTLPVACLRR